MRNFLLVLATGAGLSSLRGRWETCLGISSYEKRGRNYATDRVTVHETLKGNAGTERDFVEDDN